MKNEFLHTSKVNAEVKKFLTRHKIAAIGSAAILAMVGADRINWTLTEKSGEHILYQPTEPEPSSIDNRFRVGTWNTHNEIAYRYSDIEKIITNDDLDVLALQEVNAYDASLISEYTDGVYTTFAMGDARSKSAEGGYGDVIITKQKPKNIHARSLDGTDYISTRLRQAEGLFVDVAHADLALDQTRRGRLEDRTALALTIEVKDGDENKEIRFITSHIAGEINESQIKELGDFIKDNLKPDRPTFFCGDLNLLPGRVIPWFENMGFEVLKTDHTWVDSNWVIDYCAYNSNGTDTNLRLQNVEVPKEIHTDHYPVIAKWLFDLPHELSQHYPKPPSEELLKKEELTLHYPKAEPSAPDGLLHEITVKK